MNSNKIHNEQDIVSIMNAYLELVLGHSKTYGVLRGSSKTDAISTASPESDAIQETTMQVPCGRYSIFDPDMAVPAFNISVYTAINHKSNWDTGKSHAISHRKLAKLLNVKCVSQINRAIKWLIEHGWLRVIGKTKNGTYIYQITHHNCDPKDVPLDKDGRPLKCAVPMGKGSGFDLLAQGKITWRMAIQWTVSVIESAWGTGIIEKTMREMHKLLRFSMQTICDNAKKLREVGLFERLSKPFAKSRFQIFPLPYPKRRKRQDYKGKKPLPLIGKWYFSYNKRWKFHKETYELYMEDVDGRWRRSSYSELIEINPKIHFAFKEYQAHLSIVYGNA